MFTEFGVDPIGTGWGDYNSACDLNSDNKVNLLDLSLTAANYGKSAG
jgi:hypothetical protein